MALDTVDMTGKVCMVTGATDGIGKQTALVLLRMGAHVVGVGRNPKKIDRAIKELKRKSGKEQIDFLAADFSRLDPVRRLAAEYQAQYNRLDVLINNAGMVSMTRQVTYDGLESMFVVNHLGHFLLTMLLLGTLKASRPARIINVSSNAHVGARLDFDDLQSERDFGTMKVYGRTKLANLYFTYELARRLRQNEVTVNAVHPGFVATNLGADSLPIIGGLLKKVINISANSVEKGAETVVYLAASPEVAEVSGKYFIDCKPVQSSPASYDEAAAIQLWDMSSKLAGLNGRQQE